MNWKATDLPRPPHRTGHEVPVASGEHLEAGGRKKRARPEIPAVLAPLTGLPQPHYTTPEGGATWLFGTGTTSLSLAAPRLGGKQRVVVLAAPDTELLRQLLELLTDYSAHS